jgi:predicted ABC-type ATPase
MGSRRRAARKKIVIIAGPNGAGKTTFAREFLPNEAGCPVFVNADLIASGLSPFAPQVSAGRAGRLMLEEIRGHVRAGRSLPSRRRLPAAVMRGSSRAGASKAIGSG